MHHYSMYVVIVLGQVLVANSGYAAEPQSTRSWPPDTTPYQRPEVDDDYYPESAGPIASEVFIVDTVVNNTNPILTNTDTFNDGETSIAVNPNDPREIVISAFSGGWGANAPIFHTIDGGLIWTKQFTVPVPPGWPLGCPCDWTWDYGRNDELSATVLALSPTAGGVDVVSGTTTNPALAAAWNYFDPPGPPVQAQETNINLPSSLGGVDQPWLLVNPDPSPPNQDNVYVGYDDFTNTDGVDGPDMRVAASYGLNPPNFTVDMQTGNSRGFVNPGHRLAKDPITGVMYSMFGRCEGGNCSFFDDPKNVNYMLNRSDDGGLTWSLGGGTVVANADSTQPQPKFGTVNALLGNVLHGAVDPNTGDLYYAYGNRDAGTGNDRLAIRRIVDNGVGGVNIGAESFVTGQVEAAIPVVAVTESGTVGVFYYTFDGFSPLPGNFPIFTAHLALSEDQGGTFTDEPLLTFLSSATDNGNARQRVLGDYMQMQTVGNCFYGSFTGNGVPLGRPFANHDPVFFKVCSCNANAAGAIIGTSGPDNLVGTPGDDVIIGLEGNDNIVGGGGNDCIDAGPGDDNVSGGSGDDVILGGAGNDANLSGGNGNDQIIGGDGDNELSGGADNDWLQGGPGDDRLAGGGGDDGLDGAAGQDLMSGGGGIDSCINGEIVAACEAP